MSEPHRAYLSLGSNIEPQVNLVHTIQLLQNHGTIERISSAWASKSVGAPGPNYLNACVLFITALKQPELKEQILYPIEIKLGRRRSDNRFAPRTIDIDIILFDDQSCDDKYWEQAFVVVPLAEIYPALQNPLAREPITETATRLRSKIWVEARPEVLSQFHKRNRAG
jgi:2-amino-4-hydroxy-6-hydroxymethyldihydropteridine diphosphokinase